MDSVSQFALGAAIGEAVLGRSLGRKAMLLGGLLGTLPDLDVLVHYTDAVESFTYHRSWSHSIFTLTVLSPLLAWLLKCFYPTAWLDKPSDRTIAAAAPQFSKWWLCTWLILITHALLDGFTIYGTQLFWPLAVKPVAWGSIFIIDPLYTLPLLIALIVATKYRAIAKKAAAIGLAISSVYLALALLSQHHARNVAHTSLNSQSLATNNVLIAPAPFALLWRIVSMDGEHYHEGFYSLLDNNNDISFATFNSNRHLIDSAIDHWPVARLGWFTNNSISATIENEKMVINDLRMGVESSYVFRFVVGEFSDGQFDPTISELLPLQIDPVRMKLITRRYYDENVNLYPQ